MIDKIVVKQFQSHNRTVLRLGPGINGIIGLPNSGKTALIRAILLLKNNRPSGYAFHNDLTDKPTEVHIKPNNEPLLKFIKKKSKGRYYYGKELFMSGKQVPDKITNALNLDDINFGLQLGLPFLILSTPSEIARQINKVTESEVINKCIKDTNDKLSKLKSKKKRLVIGIDSTSKKLIPYKNLHKAKSKIDKANELIALAQECEEKIEDLRSIKSFVTKARISIKNQKRVLEASKLIKKAENLQKEMEKISGSITLLRRIEAIQDSLKLAGKEKQLIIRNYTKELRRSKTCPTCFSEIDSDTLSAIKEEINK